MHCAGSCLRLTSQRGYLFDEFDPAIVPPLESCISPLCYIIKTTTTTHAALICTQNKILSIDPWTQFPFFVFSKSPELHIVISIVITISISTHSILSWTFPSQAVVTPKLWILLLPGPPAISILSHQMLPSLPSPYLASWQHLAQLIDHSILLETLTSLGCWSTTLLILCLSPWSPLLFFGWILFIFLTPSYCRTPRLSSQVFSLFFLHFLGNFIQSHGFKYQLYVDGAQIYSALHFMRGIPFISIFPLWKKMQ